MASTKATNEPGIQFIEGIKGSHYRVQIRLKSCPHLSKNFDVRLKKLLSLQMKGCTMVGRYLKLGPKGALEAVTKTMDTHT